MFYVATTSHLIEKINKNVMHSSRHDVLFVQVFEVEYVWKCNSIWWEVQIVGLCLYLFLLFGG